MADAEEFPNRLKSYVPTRDDQRQHVRMVVSLMDDHDQATRYAVREVCELYRRLCDRRSKIAPEHGDPQELAWANDHESGVIDRVVGAFLVMAQGEIARVTECIRAALNPPRDGFSRDVRRKCCSKLFAYSEIETTWALANLFKHDAELGESRPVETASDQVSPTSCETER